MFKALIFISLALGTTGQLLLKKGVGMSELKKDEIIKKIFRYLFNPYVITGILFFIVSALLWIIMLSKIELSYAYPMISLSYILIAIFSKLLFKENISKLRWLSIAIIIVGVILVTLS